MKNKSKQTVLLQLSPEEASIVANALDFMMLSEGYAFDDPSFSHSNAFEASENISYHTFSFTRRELRAISGSLKFALSHADSDPQSFSNVDDDLPECLQSLKEAYPSFPAISAQVSAAIAKLSHQK